MWGAIPGEHVCARVERSRKGVLFAETVEVLESSPDRRPALADWRCGGNVLAHIGYERQLHIKSEIIRDAFARIGRLPLAASPVVTASPEEGYRMRARLHVRGARIGFMREGSHEICAVGPTRQLLPATVTWIEEAEARLRADGLRGLTSIEIAENIAATERACHLELEPGSDAARFAVLATDARQRVVGPGARSPRHRDVVGGPAISDSIGCSRARAGCSRLLPGQPLSARDARAAAPNVLVPADLSSTSMPAWDCSASRWPRRATTTSRWSKVMPSAATTSRRTRVHTPGAYGWSDRASRRFCVTRRQPPVRRSSSIRRGPGCPGGCARHCSEPSQRVAVRVVRCRDAGARRPRVR